MQTQTATPNNNPSLDFMLSREGKDASGSPSPLMRWLNPILVSINEGRILFRFTIREEWTNPFGTLHGGIIAAIMDDVMGAAVFSLGKSYKFTTISNSIDYFRHAKVNENIVAEATIIKNGRQIINAQCEIWDDNRTSLLARGTSNLILLPDLNN